MEIDGRREEMPQVARQIQELVPDSWEDYQYLRHDMLRSDPEAFPPQAYNELQDDEAAWRSRIERGIVLVAYDGTAPIGMIRATFAGDTSRVWNMYAKKEYRRAGIGRRLMADLMKKIAARGITYVDLEVEDTQIPARAMYENVLGFRELGRVPNERGGYMITMGKELNTD
ncbi:MAG TPA: GNAT family N-acetyltransferase [Patescibacteria group bacterium]|nr:GNAT family N-acetyltransferase [Patescibacteria group bacterium]